MQKIKKNPQLVIILLILFITGIVLAQKFSSLEGKALSNKALADDDGDNDSEDSDDNENDDEDKDDEGDKDDDEDKGDDEDKDDDEDDRDDNEDGDDDDDKSEIDNDDEDENDDENEADEEIKDISELIAKVENKISQVDAQGGSTTEFQTALNEVKDLVAQARAKLAAGNKAEAENLIEAADDKLENLEESVKLVIGEADDDESEAEEEDQDESRFRTAEAKEYRNIVAQFVHDLKEITKLDDIKGGIGSQVNWVAQTQNASSERVAVLLDKMSERKGFDKFMFGPNYDNIDEIKEEIAKNNVTIEALTQIMNQTTTNANVKLVLARQISLLIEQNTSLQNYVESAENTPSILGWLFRIFR